MNKKVSFAVVDENNKTVENVSRVLSKDGLVEYKGRNYQLKKSQGKKAKYVLYLYSHIFEKMIITKSKRIFRGPINKDEKLLVNSKVSTEYLIAIAFTNFEPDTKEFEPFAHESVKTSFGGIMTWEELLDYIEELANSQNTSIRTYVVTVIKKDPAKWKKVLAVAKDSLELKGKSDDVETSLKEDVATLDKAGMFSEYLLAMVYTNMNPGTKKFEALAPDLVTIKSGETMTWDNLVDKAYADAKPTGLTLREYLVSEIKKDSGKWAQTLRAALA